MSHRAQQRSALWIPLAALAACSPVQESPFEGPGYSAEQGLIEPQERYLVALTWLHVVNRPGPGSRFGELATAVGEHLYVNEPEGWVGASFRSEGRLEQYTMTAWRSEQAMLEFVVSEPHATAMSEFWEVAEYGKTAILELPAEDVPLSWDEALSVLDEAEFYLGVSGGLQ
ncbi:MAG: hypothetical protein H6740_11055 [Alphaproteobacteria bacterium]|nr:hypothetical protein [Alphaproteobacteria bacterium]